MIGNRSVKVIDRFEGKYEFLSNFYPSPISYLGRPFATVEHMYQTYKTLDPTWQRDIQYAKTPGMAKRIGQQCPIREDWETIKFVIMLSALRHKFSTSPLRLQLLNTGDARLIEGNDWGDRIWGKVNGVGENHLGRLLMQVRSEIK